MPQISLTQKFMLLGMATMPGSLLKATLVVHFQFCFDNFFIYGHL